MGYTTAEAVFVAKVKLLKSQQDAKMKKQYQQYLKMNHHAVSSKYGVVVK